MTTSFDIPIIDVVKEIYRAWKTTDCTYNLSKARLTKLVYLIDWNSALSEKKTITGINWYFNHHGPYVDDVVNAVKSSFDFTVCEYVSGSTRWSEIQTKQTPNETTNERLKTYVNNVMSKTKDMNYDQFLSFVYSTYPVLEKEKYTYLDLMQLADEVVNQSKL